MPAGFETINGINCLIEMLQQNSTFLSVCVNKTVKKYLKLEMIYNICMHFAYM